jgi:hypothetical protein
VGASADLSHVLFEEMSEWLDGNKIPVGIGNDGNSLGAQAGSGQLASTLGYVWHAMSRDGRRVFMTTGGSRAQERELYLRENPEQLQSPLDGQGRCTVASDACTIQISASHKVPADPEPNGPYPAVFWGASADGGKVFFTSRLELTNNAHTGPADNRPNLYEYNVESKELTDLTVDGADEKGADVLGVVEISEDGSYMYFVARGHLAEGATTGQANLYVIHNGGAPKFIATLANSKQDEEEEESGREEAGGAPGLGGTTAADVHDWYWGPEQNLAAVTSDGAKLAFLSERSLTGYDNELEKNTRTGDSCEHGQIKQSHGHKCDEVYLYDASTGGLVCASCNPTGAQPLGHSDFTIVEDGPAAQVLPRSFSEDGTLFFQTYDALVPRDSNEQRDVYEYKNGHVYPISNVAGNFSSQFLDASPNGRDVFIATADKLLPQDRDSRIDIYDVRVNGGFPVSVVPQVCDNGDACKPPPTAQPGVFGAPASATFSGAGNVAPVSSTKPRVKVKAKTKRCKRGSVKKRGRCVKQKAKKASNRSNRSNRSKRGSK